MPNNIPVDRLRIFGRDGYPIAEFTASVERSWAIGDEGRAQFTYASRVTDIVNNKVLNFGNWILIENSQLPPWVGVIDTPRSWGSRTVTVSCYSPEHVFGQSIGPIEIVKDAPPAGHARYLLSLVNSAEPTLITEGNFVLSKDYMQETYNPIQLDVALERIYERSLEEYQWRPVVDDSGKLLVYMDWLPSVGKETTALLSVGKGGGNVETVNNIFVEDGEIINTLLAYGDGLTWNSKPIHVVYDRESIAKYGRRKYAKAVEGATSLQMLKDNAVKIVTESRDPKATFQLKAINVGDTFQYMNLGNTLILSLEGIGFNNGGLRYDAKIRIVAMKYNPISKNKIEITTEVIQ